MIIAKAALADLITYTQSPQAIEAYGYVVSQIALAWGGNSAGMAAAYQSHPDVERDAAAARRRISTGQPNANRCL